MEQLTERQIQVVLLVGGEGLTYQAAALQMGHWYHGDQCISPETVRKYAKDVRDLLGSEQPPRRALTEFYFAHRARLEAA